MNLATLLQVNSYQHGDSVKCWKALGTAVQISGSVNVVTINL
jgi:hypothetical protein